MIKLGSLSMDEQKYICSQVSFREAKAYFQKNPRKFNDIKPGFRPEKLSDSDTLQILVRFIKDPFIDLFLEKEILGWLAQIEESCKRYVSEGYSNEEALIRSITESVFCDNCNLYFKLAERKESEDYIRLFQEAMRILQSSSEQHIDIQVESTPQKSSDDSAETLARLIDLESQLNEKTKREADYAEEISQLKHQIKSQEDEIITYKSQIEEANNLQNETQTELDYYRRLNNFADEDFDQEEFVSFQHVSVGQVRFGFDDRPFINRLADVIDGKIVLFSKDEAQLPYYNNRVKLYANEGVDEEYHIGVWSWSSEPKDNDPTKDIVNSEYNRYTFITEVVEFSHCKSLSEIADSLSEWFEKSFVVDKVLFIYNTASGTYEGLLCSPGTLEQKDSKVRLSATVNVLPHYTIKPTDLVTMAGRRFYQKMSLGVPQSVYSVRTPYDVVKRILLSRATMTALRENEMSKKEAQKSRKFLESIPTQSLIEEFADAYVCSEQEAEEYVNGFIEHADTYLSEEDMDLNVVSKALERNPDLVKLCKKQLSEDWERENAAALENAKNVLLSVEQLQKEKLNENEKLDASKRELSKEIETMQNSITEMKVLANSVEKETCERISAAKSNVAKFISDMAFVSPTGVVNISSDNSSSLSVVKSEMEHVEGSAVDDIDSFEEELTENLVLSGYEEEIAVETAQAISFSICNHLPIICGENAVLLAQCLAATINGQELTEVFLSYQSSAFDALSRMLLENNNSIASVYLIHGAFDGFNNTLFNEISNLSQKNPNNAIFILSIQGIDPKMIFAQTWNRAFYVNGDEGFSCLEYKPVHAMDVQMSFVRPVDPDDYKKIKKSLMSFAPLLTNTQISYYSKYLAAYNVGLNDSPTILNQIIISGSSSGMIKELNELFRENGIPNGVNMIEKHFDTNY